MPEAGGESGASWSPCARLLAPAASEAALLSTEACAAPRPDAMKLRTLRISDGLEAARRPARGEPTDDCDPVDDALDKAPGDCAPARGLDGCDMRVCDRSRQKAKMSLTRAV
jgi:hypothetical protein